MSDQSKTIISFTFVTGYWNLFNFHLLLRFNSCVKSDSLLKFIRLDNAAHCPLSSQKISLVATYTVRWNKWDPCGTNVQFLKSNWLFLPSSVVFLGSCLLPPSSPAHKYQRYLDIIESKVLCSLKSATIALFFNYYQKL